MLYTRGDATGPRDDGASWENLGSRMKARRYSKLTLFPPLRRKKKKIITILPLPFRFPSLNCFTFSIKSIAQQGAQRVHYGVSESAKTGPQRKKKMANKFGI